MRWIDKLKSEWGNALGAEGEARKYYDRGIALCQHQCYEEAEPELARAARLAPRWVEAQAEHGYVLFALRRHRSALAVYQRVLELDPGSAVAHKNLYILRHICDGTLDHDAYLAYSTAVDLSLGVEGPLEARLYWYQKCVQRSPGFAPAHQGLGMSYVELERFEDAREAFESAVRCDPMHPNNAEIHYNLNEIYARSDVESGGRAVREWVERGQNKALGNDERIAAWRHTVDGCPHFSGGYHNLGELLRESGRPAEAEAAYRAALEANPFELVAAQSLGALLLVDLGRFLDARDVFARLQQLDPEGEAGQRGLDAVDEALEERPQIEAYERGLRDLELGEQRTARKWFKRALAAAPSEAFGYQYMARSHLCEGIGTAALDVLREALERGVELNDPGTLRRAGIAAAAARLAAGTPDAAREALGIADGHAPSMLLSHLVVAVDAAPDPEPVLRLLEGLLEPRSERRRTLLEEATAGEGGVAHLALGIEMADAGEPDAALGHYAAAAAALGANGGAGEASGPLADASPEAGLARLARFNAAGMQLVLGERDDAWKLWEQCAHSGDDLVARTASNNLKCLRDRRGEVTLTLELDLEEGR